MLLFVLINLRYTRPFTSLILDRRLYNLKFFYFFLINKCTCNKPGDSSTCSYPYRKIGSNCYYFSTNTASWDEAYVSSFCFFKTNDSTNKQFVSKVFLMLPIDVMILSLCLFDTLIKFDMCQAKCHVVITFQL